MKLAAQPGALTPALREQLVRHKPSLLQWLHEQEQTHDLPLPACHPDPVNLYQPFPLNDLQLGFYMADDPYMEFHVRPHYYNELNVADLDLARYEQAWDKALRRHRAEIVVVTPEGLLQTVRELAPMQFQRIDLRDLPADRIATALLDVRTQMMRTELPLDRWPWIDLRISLWMENNTQRARIHYNHNNFFSDGYGTTRLLQEVDLYYRQPGTELPALSLSYRDAVLALEALSKSAVGKAAQRYWEERLPLFPDPPSLPIRTGMNRRCRSRLQRREGYLSPQAWSAFKAQSARCGLTPSNAIFAVYAEIVAAWSNSRHFVLSNMMTRRLDIHPEMRDIVGNFASLYPLEIDFRPDDTFVERARRVQEQVVSDSRRLHWGGMQMMQAWNRQKGALGVAAIPFVVGSGLFMEDFKKSDFGCLETSQVMLDHQFNELDDGRYYYVWDVLEEFFLPGVLDHMQQAYHALLERLSAEPGLWRNKTFQLLPTEQAAARQKVMPPAMALPDLCLDDFLRDAANRLPRQTALRAAGQSLDYAALQLASTRLAQRLRTAVSDVRGKNVVIIAERGAALVQAVHAVVQAGAAYVPVDPELPDERRRYIIDNSEAAVVLVQRRYLDAWGKVGTSTTLPIEELHPHAEADTPLKGLAQPVDLAYLIYTSGSTGRPKGVMIEHQSAVNTVLDINRRFGVTENDRIFGASSFGFDLSVYDLFGAAAAGATLVYPDPERALNPSHWLDVLLEEKVSVWNSAPPLALLFTEAAETRGAVLPDLRLVMLSGDWIPVDLPMRMRNVAPNARLVSLGGATEASIWSISYDIHAVDPAWQSIPYGYPLTNQPWYVLDAWGRPVPDWATGELYIGGVGLARGYWKDAEKTAAAFIAHPVTGERIYRTGDMGRYQPGGVIEFLGRRDLQVKIQGHRIELGEIESVLSADPAVSAAVVAVSGSNAHLLAYVVPSGSAFPDIARLTQVLERKLPAYMVPRVIRILERLPLNNNGKVDRKALAQLEAPHAAAAGQEVKAAPRPPLDETEARLLSIWRTALNQSALGVTDDFFDAGGQSFEAVRIVGAIREAFGQTLSLGVIWQGRTVEHVAMVLRQGQAEKRRGCLIPIKPEGNDLPLYLVHPAGGHIMCYRTLASLLERPVFGFQAPGVDGDAEPHTSIEALAARYVEELEAHQPSGPVLLGGWSSGALIAFEMAAQVRLKGREVRGVVMIDCPAPLLHAAIPHRTLLSWFLEDLALGLPVAALIDALEPCPSDPGEQLAQLSTVQAARGERLPLDLPQMTAIYRVFLGIVQGSRRYHANPVDVDVLLIRAEHDVVSEFADHPCANEPGWGWQELCKTLATASLPGSHYTLLGASSVARLAAETECWLRR